MDEVSAVKVTEQLKGAVVLDAETAWKRGYVTEVAINPADGTVLALLFRTPAGNEQAFAPEDFLLHKETKTVIGFGYPVSGQDELSQVLEKGVRASDEVVGSDVVTKDGRLLGRVTEILLQTELMQVIYRVESSGWRRLFGAGFYLAGNAPCAFSRVGARLIVPADARRQSAFRSLSESVKEWRQKRAAA